MYFCYVKNFEIKYIKTNATRINIPGIRQMGGANGYAEEG